MPTPTTRLVKNDAIAAIEPGCHAYEIRDGDHLLGVVASGSTSRGKWWVAARLSPSRVVRFGQPMVGADSRDRAVAAFLRAIA